MRSTPPRALPRRRGGARGACIRGERKRPETNTSGNKNVPRRTRAVRVVFPPRAAARGDLRPVEPRARGDGCGAAWQEPPRVTHGESWFRGRRRRRRGKRRHGFRRRGDAKSSPKRIQIQIQIRACAFALGAARGGGVPNLDRSGEGLDAERPERRRNRSGSGAAPGGFARPNRARRGQLRRAPVSALAQEPNARAGVRGEERRRGGGRRRRGVPEGARRGARARERNERGGGREDAFS